MKVNVSFRLGLVQDSLKMSPHEIFSKFLRSCPKSNTKY